eukprot:38174-Prorocentrum_minimum.AAC.1
MNRGKKLQGKLQLYSGGVIDVATCIPGNLGVMAPEIPCTNGEAALRIRCKSLCITLSYHNHFLSSS